MDLEELKKERETLNNDKRKGRAYLDLQLGNCIRIIEQQRRDIATLEDRLKLAHLMTVATVGVSTIMVVAVWMMR